LSLTLVSLETTGVGGLANRQMAFHTRGLSYIVGAQAARQALLQALLLGFGGARAGEVSAMLAEPEARLKMQVSRRLEPTATGTIVDLVVRAEAPHWQLSGRKGKQTEFSSGEALIEALGQTLSLSVVKVPFAPGLQVEPLLVPTELQGILRASHKQRARKRREILHALPRRRARGGQRAQEARQRVVDTVALPPEMEAYWQVWEEHVRKLQRIETLQADLQALQVAIARADELQSLITREYGSLHALPPGVLADLPVLAEDRAHVAGLEERQKTYDQAWEEVSQTWDKMQGELEEGTKRFADVPADFSMLLQRWQVVEEALRAEEAEQAVLNRQLQDNRQENRHNARFDVVVPDFEARLGALVVLEDEDSSRLATTRQKLTQAQNLSSAKEDLHGQLQKEFEALPDGFPDQLRELQAVRVRWADLKARVDPIDNDLQAELENRPVYLEWASMWPADFPSRLKQWRSQHRSEQREKVRRDWHVSERSECHRLCAALERQLAGQEGLHQQEDGFPERLLELLNTRQQRKIEAEAWDNLKERIEALEPVVRDGRERYAMLGDRYLEWVDALRGKMWELRQKQQTRQRYQTEREDLERQLSGAEQTLQSEYADLRSAPVDFPARLREFFRLRQVETELRGQETALNQSQTRLERTLAEKFSFLEHLGEEIRKVVEEGRSRDETLHKVLVRLEKDIENRRRIEERLTVVRHAMRGHRHFERLPEGALQILAMAAPAETHDEAEDVPNPSPAQVWEDIERERLRTLQDLHQRLAAELGEEAGEMAAHYSDWRSWREEAALLESQLDLLPPLAESETLRTNLLGLVAASLHDTGLTIQAEEYLEYQTVKAEIARVLETKERLLQRSGSGNDLSRIRSKLEELSELLGSKVTGARLHDSVARYEAVSVLRGTMHRLTSALEALPPDERLTAECKALQEDIRIEMKRLHIVDADDVEAGVARFQTYQTATSSLEALQEMCRQRWTEGAPAHLAKLDSRLAALDDGLGQWATRVQSETDVMALRGRWKLARQIHSELQAVRDRLARVESFAADAAEANEPPEDLDVADGDADDEVLLAIWHEYQQSEGRMVQWRAARAELLEAGSDGASLLDTLQTRITELEAATRPFDTSQAVEAVIELFEEDRRRRADIQEIDGRLASLPPEKELIALSVELKDRYRERRSAMSLDPDEEVQTVLRDYRRYIELNEERRTLLRLLGARDAAIAEQRARLEELAAQLGARTKDLHAAAELAAWQTFQEKQSQALKVQVRRGDLEREGHRLAESRRLLEERIKAVESRLNGQPVDPILRDYVDYMRLREELAPLQQRLSAPPGVVSLRHQLAEANRGLEHLVPPPSTDAEGRVDPSGGEEDGEESAEARPLERLGELLAELSEGKLVRASVDDEGRTWLWSADRVRTPAAEGPAWLLPLWHLVLVEDLGDAYPWPVVLPEPFADLEDGPFERLMTQINGLGKIRQVIVLTGSRDRVNKEAMVADLDG
jgi:hypothetical protein